MDEGGLVTADKTIWKGKKQPPASTDPPEKKFDTVTVFVEELDTQETVEVGVAY